jgi:twinkle protein
VLHPKHQEWLKGRKLDPILAEKFGIETVERNGVNWLAVPYQERGSTLNHKYRQTMKKRFMMDQGAPLTLCNHDVLLLPEVQSGQVKVIITEGEWDMLAAIQSGFEYTLSVPNGAGQNPNFDYLERCEDLLAKVKTFILATDNDEAGLMLRDELVRRFGPGRCEFIEYPDGCKDLNETLVYGDVAIVSKVLNGAKPFPVQGMYRFDEIPEPSPLQSYSFGIPGLSEFYSIVPKTLTVITGHPGHGKTSLTMAIIANLVKSGMHLAVASYETMPKPIMLRRLRANYLGCQENEVHKFDTVACDRALNERLTLIYQNVDDDAQWDIDYLIMLAETAVFRDGIRVLLIDPWNEIEHKRRNDETETDYTGRALRALRRFAQLNGVAVIIVAHPAKPDKTRKISAPTLSDISGSANWANKPDYGLCVHREDHEGNLCDVYVNKVRMGFPGKKGKLTLAYDWRTSSYSNCETGEIE